MNSVVRLCVIRQTAPRIQPAFIQEFHSRIYIAPLRVPYYSEAAVVFTLTCQYHQPSSEEKRRREEIGEECGSLKYGLLIDFKWKNISKIVFFTTCILEPENVWW